jgi:transposase
MKRTRKRYGREFKISIVSELEYGKPLVQIARENGINPSLPCRWRDELAENPERANNFNGNRCKYEARIDELERLLGRPHAENKLF